MRPCPRRRCYLTTCFHMLKARSVEGDVTRATDTVGVVARPFPAPFFFFPRGDKAPSEEAKERRRNDSSTYWLVSPAIYLRIHYCLALMQRDRASRVRIYTLTGKRLPDERIPSLAPMAPLPLLPHPPPALLRNALSFLEEFTLHRELTSCRNKCTSPKSFCFVFFFFFLSFSSFDDNCQRLT